ncbi:MAG: protein-L-isoaspartate(D-aspartate) O-methyltransferase [Rhodobiaceae bacterium]|nr:protein-L-isoaspartate(D-aspartate) O-methyltransferase [Rhodobiaceae bacterium]MCC0041550.1 protein-L-isoaspartate(D-aspartate) O-methyltransferase [Rhodobiaceae bacterium]MCC0052789.1 protein-L-isoaspartate(D-aspartate) O-methyltransferase [Rhodobiaceae bacterium]
MHLRARGIGDVRLLAAIEQVPRDQFLPRRFAAFAYDDRIIPIACGQTASTVHEAAELALAARIAPEHRVLEVGTGTGYMTAILSRMAVHVFTIERYRRLVDYATERLLEQDAGNVVVVHGDGFLGLSEHAPFDRIILGGSCQDAPEHLLDQLADKGELVAAVGASGSAQKLTRFRRGPDGIAREDLGQIRLPPLVAGRSRQI